MQRWLADKYFDRGVENPFRGKDGAVPWTETQRLRMLGCMRSSTERRFHILRGAAPLLALLAAVAGSEAAAQSCTSQAKMTAATRAEVGGAAFKLATAVLAGDSGAVQAATISQFASNFSQTAYLIHATAGELAGDTLSVSQAYLLDASARAANDASDANFSCPLIGTAAETDFAIAGLPPGRYAFVMVEASGPHPWLLSFLLQAEASGGWKMAGFYPHARDAAGHNGVWYWDTARTDEKAGKPWLAWVLYGEADQLLRPAAFVSSTNLDRLRSETRRAAPPALSDGVSSTTPLALAGPNGTEFRITSVGSEASENGKQLNLVIHLRGETSADSNTQTAKNVAAGAAFLTAHPELRAGFDNLWVVADVAGANPVVTEKPMAEVAAGK